MNGRFETSGIYPLSTIPLEGYGSEPGSRSGKIVLTHTNHKFVKVKDDGTHKFVEKAIDATQYDSHTEAALAAAKLLKRSAANPVEMVD